MPAVRIAVIPVTPFQQNCSIVTCTATGRAAVVDPGRTDFPYGDRLIAAIKGKLLVLDDDVTILPGHGPASTIGAERAHNPFVRG